MRWSPGWYDPEQNSLANFLQIIVDDWEWDRDVYWVEHEQGEWTQEEAEQNKTYLELADLIATAILDARLTTSDVLRPGIKDSLRGDLRATVLERLHIDIAGRFVGRIEETAERVLQIGSFILEKRPGKPVITYLNRLARCYVEGFFPECTILCRSVIENALRDRFEAARLEMTGDLAEKIDFAYEKLGWLTKGAWKNAHEVRRRGNKAIHYDPHATTQVLGTIESTMDVLGELYQ